MIRVNFRIVLRNAHHADSLDDVGIAGWRLHRLSGKLQNR